MRDTRARHHTAKLQREREALQALVEERERRHKAELLALEAQMQAKLAALTLLNEDLTRRFERANGVTRRIDCDGA